MENTKTVKFWLERKAWAEGYIVKYSNQLVQYQLLLDHQLSEGNNMEVASIIQDEIDYYGKLLGDGYMLTHLKNAVKALTALAQQRADDLEDTF